MNSCLATDCAVLMHAEYEDVSIERGLWWRPKRQMLTLAVLRFSQTPEITRLYEGGKTVSRVMKIRSGLFSIFLSLLPLIISAFNSCSALKGAFSLMVAMKLCSAQLRHQKGAMTARPHAARGNRTGSQKESLECFRSSTECSPPWSKRYKTQQLDKQPPLPKSIHTVLGLHNDICIDMLVVTLSSWTSLTILITSVISSSFQFAFLTSQQSPFPALSSESVVSPSHPLIPIIQLSDRISRRVSTMHKGAPM